MNAEEHGAPYELVLNGWVKDRIKRLQRLAVLVGQRDRLKGTLLEIESALHDVPTTWGDPLKDLQGFRLIQYRRLIRQLVVLYAVHMDKPLVWLTSVEPVRGSPLWIGEG